MVYLTIAIPLLIITTILGIIFLGNWGMMWVPSSLTVINGIGWIAGIVLLFKGISVNHNNKEIRQLEQEKAQWKLKQQQDEEIKKLKEKIEQLEEDKKK